MTIDWELRAMTPEQKEVRRKQKRREYYLAHRDEILARLHEYNAKNKPWRKYKHRYNYNTKWRDAAMDAMGGKCERCGFDDKRALQFDHVNGDGRGNRTLGREKRDYTYYKNIAEMDHAERKATFQLLCANCNWIKRAENKEYN